MRTHRPLRHRLAPILLALLAICLFRPAAAEPPSAYIVIDAASGRSVLSKDPDLLVHPASLTKMMTLYLLFDALDDRKVRLGTPIRFSKNAARQPPSDLGVPYRGSITVKTAILALAVKSANDVAVAVAEKVAGSERAFVARMNAKARDLGMARTNFVNPSGLHAPEQVSTPRDLAQLARALRYKHKSYYKYFQTKQFTYSGRTIRTHNHFVRKYDGADGIKTGYVRASGFNLAGSAVRDGRRLIGVIVGGQSASQRDLDLMGVMDAGFRVAGSLPAPRYAGIAPVGVDFTTGLPALPPRRDGVPAPELADDDASPIVMASAEVSDIPSPPRRSDPAPGAYAAQVGAVSSEKAAALLAVTRLKALGRIVAGGEPAVATLDLGDGRQIYRARIHGLTDKQARSACLALRQTGRDCLVIRPG